MTSYSYWRLVAFLVMLVQVCWGNVRYAHAAEPVALGPIEPVGRPNGFREADWRRLTLGFQRDPALLEIDWPDGWPVVRAFNPAEAQWQVHFPDDLDRKFHHERDAVLPDPDNGRELVDRVFVQKELHEQPLEQETATSPVPEWVAHVPNPLVRPPRWMG